MNLFIIPLAGIIITVLMSNSMPDSTAIWLILFAVGCLQLTFAEIRTYLRLHAEREARFHQEQASMAELMKEKLLVKKNKPATPADEAKLVEQMANELKARIGSGKELSAANLKQITNDMKNQMSPS